jgi:membrane-bound metal-dependent hydrolase YbcI (DUF457 family)
MQGTTHLAAGALAGVVVAQQAGISDPAAVALVVVVAGAGALVPDWVQVNIPGLNRTIKGLAGHRGFSHWVLTAAAGALAVSELQPQPWAWRLTVPPVAPALLWGWLSHIALDALSGHGVPAFWPLPWRLHLASFRTGGRLDQCIKWLALALALALALDLFL